MTDWLAEIEARWAAATPRPWAFNGYSGIDSMAMIDAQWAFHDAHQAAGRPYGPDGNFAGEWRERYYEIMSGVAWVPAHHGDTATGRHLADAVAIAAVPEDVARLVAEVKRLRAAAGEGDSA